MNTILLLCFGLNNSEASPMNNLTFQAGNGIYNQDLPGANAYRGKTVIRIPKNKQKETEPEQKHEPQAEKQMSIGIRGMTYQSGYVYGGEYLDPGLGVAVGYRPMEKFGGELSYSHFSEENRTNQPIQAVGQFFMFQDKPLYPFVSAGYAWNNVDLTDTYSGGEEPQVVTQTGRLTGPVIGGGLGATVFNNFSLSAEARYMMYNNIKKDQPALDNGLMFTAGINYHF